MLLGSAGLCLVRTFKVPREYRVQMMLACCVFCVITIATTAADFANKALLGSEDSGTRVSTQSTP